MVMTNTTGAAAPVPLEVDETPAPAASSSRRRRTLLQRLHRALLLYLIHAPGIVYFDVFKYEPMYGITIAFQDYLPFLGMKDSPWVGWDHLERLFSGPDFGRLLSNSLILVFLNVVIAFP